MLKEKYTDEILPKWIAEKGYANSMSVPRINKVVVNVGFGSAKDADKEAEFVLNDLETMTGQRPISRKAKKSIAGFDLREDVTVGAKVTLRKKRMYHFLEKLFGYVLPRVRDFRGLDRKGFDQQGNYSIGFEDQINFLEIDPNIAKRRRGVQVTIVTTAETRDEAEELLGEMGLPLGE